jgi:hypothetical protein
VSIHGHFVYPWLSNKCYLCHGPGPTARPKSCPLQKTTCLQEVGGSKISESSTQKKLLRGKLLERQRDQVWKVAVPRASVTNRRLRLAATTIIQRRSLNEPARSPVRHQDRPDSSLVDPEENISKQGKVSQHPQTVRPAPCINPAHLPNPDLYPICHQTLSYHLPHLTPPSWLLSFPASFPHPFLRRFRLPASFSSIRIHFLLNVTTLWSIPDLGGFCLRLWSYQTLEPSLMLFLLSASMYCIYRRIFNNAGGRFQC